MLQLDEVIISMGEGGGGNPDPSLLETHLHNNQYAPHETWTWPFDTDTRGQRSSKQPLEPLPGYLSARRLSFCPAS